MKHIGVPSTLHRPSKTGTETDADSEKPASPELSSYAIASVSRELVRHKFPTVHPEGLKPNVPEGLELLDEASKLFIRPHQFHGQSQKHLSRINLRNYDIIDLEKGIIYYGCESDVKGSGKSRQYVLRISDNDGRPVLEVANEIRWSYYLLGCIGCCGSTGLSARFNQHDGTKLGRLEQQYKYTTPCFLIQDDDGKPQLKIDGPPGSLLCCNFQLQSSLLFNAEFPVYDMNGTQVGSISRGSLDPFAHADSFGITFKEDLPAVLKAGVLGASFAIIILLFGSNDARNNVKELRHRKRESIRQKRQSNHWEDLRALGLNDGDGGSEEDQSVYTESESTIAFPVAPIYK